MAVNNIRKGNMDMLAKQMEDALGRNIDFVDNTSMARGGLATRRAVRPWRW